MLIKNDGLHLGEKLSKNKSFMLFLFQLTPKAILFFDHSLFNDKDIINWLSTDEVLHKLNNFSSDSFSYLFTLPSISNVIIDKLTFSVHFFFVLFFH